MKEITEVTQNYARWRNVLTVGFKDLIIIFAIDHMNGKRTGYECFLTPHNNRMQKDLYHLFEENKDLYQWAKITFTEPETVHCCSKIIAHISLNLICPILSKARMLRILFSLENGTLLPITLAYQSEQVQLHHESKICSSLTLIHAYQKKLWFTYSSLLFLSKFF